VKADTERLTFTIAETAKKLGIGKNQAYEAARCGEIPTIRIGKRILVPKAALDRMLLPSTGQSRPRSLLHS
jgi:excisionase family DNA binding protein